MSDKVFKQLPTFVARTYRGGLLLHRFLNMDNAVDDFYPEDWISSFVEAKNKHYIKNEGITRVLIEQKEYMINQVVAPSDFGAGRQTSGVLIKLLDAGERLGYSGSSDKGICRKANGRYIG